MSCEMHQEARKLFVQHGWADQSISDEEIDRQLKVIGEAGKAAAEAMQVMLDAVMEAARKIATSLIPALAALKEKYPEAFDDA